MSAQGKKGPMEVVAGILWRDGRYLAVQRPEGTRMAGFWEFPGGKIEPGEAPEAALVRELEEELAVSAGRVEFWRELTHHYEQLSVRLSFFHVPEFSGDPVAVEGQAFCWCDPLAPPELDFLEADAPIVAALRDFAGRFG